MAKAAQKQKTAATIATRTISLRLLRKDRTVDDAVRANRDLQEHATKTGRLFYDQSDDNTPPWLELVNQFTADGELRLRNKSCTAILFLDIESAGGGARTFALTFGGASRDPRRRVRTQLRAQGRPEFDRPRQPQESRCRDP